MGTISGYVYKAVTDNGIKDDDETAGIQGVKIYLKNLSTNSIAEILTDNNGQYLFQGLEAGTYDIIELPPGGYNDGFDGFDRYNCSFTFAGSVNGVTVGTSQANWKRNIDKFTGIRIEGTENENVGNFNFGEVEIPLMSGRASISGRVSLDINQNNTIGDVNGEGYLSGQRVLLYKDGRQIAYANTNAQGLYLFNNLNPGNYKLRQSQSTSFVDGKDYLNPEVVSCSSGGNDIFNISVIAGDRFTEFNFTESGVNTLPPSPIYIC